MAYKSKYTGKQVDDGLDLAFTSQERIDTAIRNLVDGAPENLDTLKEVAEYIASDESRVADILQSLANLAKKDEELQTAINDEVESSEQMYESLLSSITTAKNDMRSSTPIFDKVVAGDVTLAMGSATTNYQVVYLEDKKLFAALNAGKYWANWLAWGKYPSAVSYGPAPAVGKVYIMGNALYVWNGSSLNEVGDFDEIKKSIAHNTGDIANNVQAIDLLAEEVETKAPKEGYAPDLKVDFAKELVGRGVAEPQEIGNIRPTGEISIGDGNATIEKVKGKSVVYNQHCNYSKIIPQTYGLTFEAVGDKIRMYGTSTKTLSPASFRITRDSRIRTKGHKYLVYDSVSNISCKFEADKFVVIIHPYIVEGEYYDKILGVSIHDLTQMFGAGNEPTTIEEFEARKPLGVSNEYNEGEIISYDAQELKSVGFNAWDEEWEVGGIANGEPSNTTSQIRSKNFTPCVGGQKYYGYMEWSSDNYLHLAIYDANKNFIENRGCNRNEVTLPDDAAYFKVFTTYECGYGNVYKGDICINLSHSGYRNGKYLPYEEDSLQLPNIKAIKDKDGNPLFPYGLLSAGSAYDEVTERKAIKRMGMVDMGDLHWNAFKHGYTGSFTNFHAKIRIANGDNIVCEKYATYLPKAIDNDATIEGIAGPQLGYWRGVFVVDSTLADLDSVKQAMRGVMLYYELAEPIEVDLPEPLNLTYDAWDFGTEELVAEGKTTPLNADIVYQFNAVDRIRENTAKNKALEAELAELKAQLTQLTQVSNGDNNA